MTLRERAELIAGAARSAYFVATYRSDEHEALLRLIEREIKVAYTAGVIQQALEQAADRCQPEES